ncbi:recombinase family protein [Legionella bozemanae]|uniref:recombinase family protein n=1 Tax=Legionella bozemanae TaxID=447 RepID=UPI003EE8DBA4
MPLVGYARVSTTDQDYSIQEEALKNAGCIKIFAEKKSGNSKDNRKAFNECMNFIREGDTLVVTRIDRLTRSIRDLQNLLHDLRVKQIHLKAIEQPVDTSTAAGKFFIDMLGVFAEFETNLRRERQMEGIQKAKQLGKYKGRKPTARALSNQVVKLAEQGNTKKTIAQNLGIGIASVFRILRSHKITQSNLESRE